MAEGILFKKTKKIMKQSVDELVPLSHKTAACTHDIISYAPGIYTVNRHDVFACTSLYHELHSTCQYITYRLLNVFCYTTPALPC